jgi:hypothetical protein
MSLLRNRWFAPIVVFLVALVLRVAYVDQSARQIGLDSDRLTQLDTYVFSQWARVIADGDILCWKQPHAYHLWTEDVAPESKWLEWYGGERTYHQAPLYAYVVATVYRCGWGAAEALGDVRGRAGRADPALTALLARRLSLAAGRLGGRAAAGAHGPVLLLRRLHAARLAAGAARRGADASRWTRPSSAAACATGSRRARCWGCSRWPRRRACRCCCSRC